MDYICCGKNDILFFDDYIINNYDNKNEKIKLVNSDFDFRNFKEIKGFYIMDGTDTKISIRKKNDDIVAVFVECYTFELEDDMYQSVNAINEDEAWEKMENCCYDIVGMVE